MRYEPFIRARPANSRFAAWSVRVAAVFLLVLAAAWIPAARAWDVVTYRGRGHVSLDQMAGFYGFEGPVADGREQVLRTRGVEIRCVVGAKQISINRLRFHLSYPIVSLRGKSLISVFDVTHLVDPVLRAPRVEQSRALKTIVIDPAHGGEETGVTSRLGKESELMLALAETLRADLEGRGYEVRLTRREGDPTLGPEARALVANAVEGEAVFVSLHANRSSNAATKGAETYTLAPAGTPSTYDPDGTKPDLNFYLGNLHEMENMMLATALHGAMVVQGGAADLGIKRARFGELRGVRMPGVVLRVGYLTNPEDGRRMADAETRKSIARSLGDGIDRYAKYLKSGGTPEDPARRLRITDVAVETMPKEPAPGKDENKSITVKIESVGEDPTIDPAKVDIEVYVIDLVDGEWLEPAAVDPPTISWLSVLPNWNDHRTEELQVLYHRPAAAPEAGATKPRNRRFFGYAVRILYDGHLQDTVSNPPALERCLYQFYALPSQ